MNKTTLILSLIITIIFSSCGIMKKNASGHQNNSNLSGGWVLTYISGPRIAFEGLYPENKPTAVFDMETNRLSGNTSCNSYGSTIQINKDKIKIEKPFSTMMACQGSGESVFINTLLKVESFKVQKDTLSFYIDNVEMMRFVKQ